MNHISPCNHPESALTGSTIEAMIHKTKALGLDYFAITDLGYLTSILKGYSYGKEEGVKIIAGVELFFKDDECPIIKGTESEQIKYFKIIVHAKDQEAYQKIVKMCSDTRRKQITVSGNTYGTFNWADLSELAKSNITIATSNIECMVSKHLLVNRADLGLKYYEKLRALVGPDNFYPSIIPHKQDKYWSTTVKATLGDGKVVYIPAIDKIETDQKFKEVQAVELTRRGNKHNLLKSVFINNVKFTVKPEFQNIQSAKLINSFQELPGGDIQTKANKFIIALANKNGDQDRILINNYAYYADKEDKIVQDMKLGDEKRVYLPQFMSSVSDIREYLSTELGLLDHDIDSLIKNSHEWANNFKDFTLQYEYRLPAVDGDPVELLRKQIDKIGRMKWDDPAYVKQYSEELNLLTNNGVLNLIPYFLPIVDIYDYYKDNGFLTGPGRGSAGGFLISYLLGITHIDPIKYKLSSSRFLTMDRIKQGNLPDIDSDLENRAPLVGMDGSSGYLFNKYGNKAAQVSTRTLLRIKSAILDANRFFNNGVVNQDVTRLSKSLPTTPQNVNDIEYIFGYEDDQGVHHEGLLEKSEDLRKYAAERPQEWDLVKRTLSLVRQNSRHACSFLIADKTIEDIIPTFEVGGVKRITQPTAKQCEEAGLIKYDFLVVSALKDINLCLSYINKKNKNTELKTGYFKHNGIDTYIWDLPQDPAVYQMLTDGKTETVFQLNTAGSTPTVKKVKPTSIVDLATITSLERPGPKDFKDPVTGRNMVEEYIMRKNGQSVETIQILNEMLPETHSVLVFQEQITKIAQELGGMSVEDSENVRIAMGKKKKKLLESLKPTFISGAEKKVDRESAEKIWSMMETFARYGFNKCFHKDTVIYRNKNKATPLTIGEMYKAKNDKVWAKKNNKEAVGKKYRLFGYGKGWSKKGNTLHPNEIVDIRFEGMKEVFKVTTESGKSVTVTKNHKFPTPRGEFALEFLSLGDELYVNSGYKQEDTTYRFNTGDNLPTSGQQGFQKKPNSPYNLLKEREVLLKENYKNCQTCGCDLTNTRKEIHHIDGDHGNQNLDNLILVCPSCHKKAHYKMGRTKHGEKGLAVAVEKIVSIEYSGIDEVYDVEMKAPHHNLVINDGIVASNSHAVAYVVISYACAFLKYHYPLEWWASVLSNADQKEINEVFYKYIKDTVLPPDVNTSTEEMVVDYNLNKIRNKLSMISGIGEKAAEKIIALRPYSDIIDFTRKKACGPGMTKKLIHVGALDSLFAPGESLINKISKYDQALSLVEFEEKLVEYDERLEEFNKKGDSKGVERTAKLKERAIEKGPKDHLADEFYPSLKFRHKLDYLVKKSIFPTINLDLGSVLKKDSKKPIISGSRGDMVMDNRGREVKLLSGEHLQQIDNVNLTQEAKFCVPGYIMKAEEFYYQGGERKALKMIIDSSGYISEKVLWPDYNTGQLMYPQNLKEGCIAYLIYTKKPDKPFTNISEIIVEEESITA